MKKFLIVTTRAYQKYISSIVSPSCRYYPSCSQYMIEALEKYGSIKGSLLAVRRIMRCHPFSTGGYDPVK